MGECAREKVVSLANAIHRVYRKADGQRPQPTAAAEARL
jgi:hypothetical protein